MQFRCILDAIQMHFRSYLDAISMLFRCMILDASFRCLRFYSSFVSLLIRVGGWVVGKLESNAKLNSKVKVEVEVGVELGNLRN